MGLWGTHGTGSSMARTISLNTAVFAANTSVQGLRHIPSSLVSENLLLAHKCLAHGLQMAQSTFTAPVLFLVAEMAPRGMCPYILDVGGKLPFSSTGSCFKPQKARISQSQSFVHKQALSPGRVMTPGCLEEERWK